MPLFASVGTRLNYAAKDDVECSTLMDLAEIQHRLFT